MSVQIQNSLSFFVNVLIEIIPLFLAVTFLAGLALEYIKPQVIRERLGGKKGITGILAATALGFVTPFCSCSTIPLLAGMIAAGIPIGVLTAFLFASPYPVEVGIIVLGPMFGWGFAIAFVATGAIIAIVSGLFLQRLNWQNQVKNDFVKGLGSHGEDNRVELGEVEQPCGWKSEEVNIEDPKLTECGCGEAKKLDVNTPEAACSPGTQNNQPKNCNETTNQVTMTSSCGCGTELRYSTGTGKLNAVPKDGFLQKSKRAVIYSLGFFKRMFPFILLGCTMGALIYGFVPEDILATYMGGTSILAVPVAALIGVPLYVSIIPIIPIILSLSTKGVSTGAVIAFMITATSISPPELIMLSGMFKRRYIALFVIMMIVGAILTGYIFNIIAL